jgi:monoamine oxidase
MCDVVVVGAGPAGIAAAHALQRAGMTVQVVEARERPGGRVQTALVAGQQIDLGAHWFELPEARAARRALATLTDGRRRAPGEVRLHGQDSRSARNSFWRHWNGIEARLADARPGVSDTSLAAIVSAYWAGRDEPWRDTLEFHLALECGAPLGQVSARDYENHEDTEYYFIEGGYGALLAARAAGLNIAYGAPVVRIAETGAGMVVETAQAGFEARQVVVAVPAMVLAAGAIRFEPALPAIVQAALAGFHPARYERALIHWPRSPLHEDGADSLHIFYGNRMANAEILACVDGGDLHYVEIGGNLAARWQAAPDPVAWRRDFAAAFLRERFGPAAAAAEIVHVTDWSGDPFARGSWAVCPPGAQGARQILNDFAHPRLQFAGEATSTGYWGTATGAWLEGERVAAALVAARQIAGA